MSKILVAVALFLGILIGSFSNSIVTNVFSQVVTGNNIHGCINDTTGAVRIVPNNTNCNSGETLETWRKLEKGEGNFPLICPDCSFNSEGPIGNLFKNKDFTGAYMPQARFGNNADMSGVNLSKSILQGAIIGEVNLDNASIKNANLEGITIEGLSTIQNVNFTSTNFTHARFNAASDFSGSNFSSTNLTDAYFFTSDLQNANFNNAIISEARFVDSNLLGAINLSTAIRGSNVWSNTICPDGTNSDTNGGTCEGHL